ncbi:MAG: hypothetical protein U1E26_00905 [Coriobacteriia bacterium]|nr:hypothetical protein [Coriobacteriia bacterium]
MERSRDDLRTSALGLLWAQWTEIGVAGTVGSGRTVVDPEAMLVATLSFGRQDPRLFDEVLDWLLLNGRLLDVTRLRRILKSASAEVQDLAAVMIELLQTRVEGSKWNPLSEMWHARESRAAYAPSALFRDSSGDQMPSFGETDPFFAERGYVRPPLALRGMSTHPRTDLSASSRFAARALCGIGVRAETLLYLWTHETAHGRLIASRTAYSQRQVAEYLAGLAEAGFAQRYEVGRSVQYRLVPEAQWAPAGGSAYVDWMSAFGALEALHAGVDLAARAESAYEASVAVRSALRELAAALPIEGMDIPLPTVDAFPGEAVLEHATQVVDGACKVLREYSAR